MQLLLKLFAGKIEIFMFLSPEVFLQLHIERLGFKLVSKLPPLLVQCILLKVVQPSVESLFRVAKIDMAALWPW